MKPVIAITTRTLHNDQKDRYITQKSYMDALTMCDATYISVIPTQDHDYAHIVKMCDGLLISGGGDMSAFYYGEQNHPSSDLINTLTDEMDLALIDAFYKAKKPILGICRGFQVLNVYFKGSLYQDLPTQYQTVLKHRQEESRDIGTHFITLNEDSFLGKKGTSFAVNSFHHQGIKEIGRNLKVVAYSEDNLIEAFEKESIMAVQWHPECMMQDAFHHAIFEKFLHKCKESMD